MEPLASVLKGLLLIVGAFFALGIATWLFNVAQVLVVGGSLGLSRMPTWLRWVILIPAIVVFSLILIIAFNVIFLIGDWFGESFVGTAWEWGATFIQSAIVPSLLVTTAFLIAPNGRRWIAIAMMLVIWLTLFGSLFDSNSADNSLIEFDTLFHGALLLAAVSAAWGVLKMWDMEPMLRALESGTGHDVPNSDIPDYAAHYGGAKPDSEICTTCGESLGEGAAFCSSCGASVGTNQETEDP